MSQNGTTQTIDGITLDANRISRREFMRLTMAMDEAPNVVLRDQLTAELATKIVTSWPFGDTITIDAYLDLGLMDSKRVDQALTQLMEDIAKKNLQSL